MYTLCSISPRLKMLIRRYIVNCSAMEPPQPLHSSGNFSIKFTRLWIQVLIAFLAFASQEWVSHLMVSKNYMGWDVRCSLGGKPTSSWPRNHLVLFMGWQKAKVIFRFHIEFSSQCKSRSMQFQSLPTGKLVIDEFVFFQLRCLRVAQNIQ